MQWRDRERARSTTDESALKWGKGNISRICISSATSPISAFDRHDSPEPVTQKPRIKMVIKVYVSGMSGNKEVKKRQQRVTMIMDSKHIEYTVIDITEPGQEGEKDFMQVNAQHKGCTISDPNPRHALPPQLFNDTEYCGDYDDFDMANEVDNLEVFLKLAAPAVPEVEHKNGGTTGEEATEATDAVVDDDENKENKTEDNVDGGAVVAEAATEDGANEV